MNKIIAGALIAAAIPAAISFAPTASAYGYNQETVDRFITQVNIEAARYHLGHIQVYVDNIDGDASIMASTDGSGVITINANWAALSTGVFDANVNNDIATGYHPGGCTGIEAVAIHEVGHVIDRRGGMAARQVVTRATNAGRVGKDLHGYAFNSDGSINPAEAIGVSFQAHECGTATSTEEQIYNVLVSTN